MVGWHHQLEGHEFEQAPGLGDGQGRLACCSPWGCKELDTTEQLNWTEIWWWTLLMGKGDSMQENEVDRRIHKYRDRTTQKQGGRVLLARWVPWSWPLSLAFTDRRGTRYSFCFNCINSGFCCLQLYGAWPTRSSLPLQCCTGEFACLQMAWSEAWE